MCLLQHVGRGSLDALARLEIVDAGKVMLKNVGLKSKRIMNLFKHGHITIAEENFVGGGCKDFIARYLPAAHIWLLKSTQMHPISHCTPETHRTQDETFT